MTRTALALLGATIALISLAATPEPATTLAPAALNAEGIKRYGDAWSPEIGDWLPYFGDPYRPYQKGLTTETGARDGFVSAAADSGKQLPLGFQGPADGTFFVFGQAGPHKGHVVYDAAHRIAFYEQGCCSWFEVAAASDMMSPPKPVMSRDLSELHTVRGIRFGQTQAEVMKIYGPSEPLQLSGHPDEVLLAYTTWPPFHTGPSTVPPSGCGQDENFVFRNGRLVYIGLENGC